MLDAAKHNRISVLLGNKHFPQTCTVTHTMWAMFGIVELRHPSRSRTGTSRGSRSTSSSTARRAAAIVLVGTELGGNSEIVNPVRVDWEPGLAFVTPPGYWHAHYNESDGPAHVIPLQDAGLGLIR